MTKHAIKVDVDSRQTGLVHRLAIRGMPKQVLACKGFELEPALATFTSDVQGLKPKTVQKKTQIEHFRRIRSEPFYGPYVCCISGRPNDLRAKLLAAMFMSEAMLKQPSVKKRGMSSRGLPLWHTVTGNFANPLVEKPGEKPSMLVLANIPVTSTQVKLEKLRDILETYSDIPRIIITVGEDPLTFFNTKLFLPLNHCFYLTNPSVKRITEI